MRRLDREIVHREMAAEPTLNRRQIRGGQLPARVPGDAWRNADPASVKGYWRPLIDRVAMGHQSATMKALAPCGKPQQPWRAAPAIAPEQHYRMEWKARNGPQPGGGITHSGSGLESGFTVR